MQCARCSREFDAARRWQRFCSNECRRAYHLTKRAGQETYITRQELVDVLRAWGSDRARALADELSRKWGLG